MTDSFEDVRLTERRNPRTAAIDTATPLELVDLIGAEDASVPGRLRELARRSHGPSSWSRRPFAPAAA